MSAMTVCSKCASAWPQGTPFCSTCGTSLLMGGVLPAFPPVPTPPRTSGMAITGFVLSFFCGVLGLIFSLIGYFDCKKSHGQLQGEGFALAGIILSLVSIVGSIFVWFMFIRAVDTFGEVAKSFDDLEPRMELRHVGRSAVDTYYKKGAFPTIDNTPTTSCCSEEGNRCRGGFEAPAWREIGFESFSSGHYRLGYRSTPKKFTAIAVGDSDCDGNEVTYTMEIDIVGGDPITGMIQRSGID